MSDITLPCSTLQHIISEMENMTMSDQFHIFKYLQTYLRQNSLKISKMVDDASDPEQFRRMLFTKKEVAIEEIVNLLPFIDANNVECKNTFLKILPVFFSYVSLYDMRVEDAIKMMEILKTHQAFLDCQSLFQQWFVLFERRKEKKRKFAYKDESYVRDLIPLMNVDAKYWSFTESIGYGNIGLLRCFHRWLRLHRLHKYLYFFSTLTYQQIIRLDEHSLNQYVSEIRLMEITEGAKNKIIREVNILRQRSAQLKTILRSRLELLTDIVAAIKDVKKILRTPIATKPIDVLNETLPELLVATKFKLFEVISKLDYNDETVPIFGLFISILKEAWNYNIFTPQNKDDFNHWREDLSISLKKYLYLLVGVAKGYDVPPYSLENQLYSPGMTANWVSLSGSNYSGSTTGWTNTSGNGSSCSGMLPWRNTNVERNYTGIGNSMMMNASGGNSQWPNMNAQPFFINSNMSIPSSLGTKLYRMPSRDAPDNIVKSLSSDGSVDGLEKMMSKLPIS